MAQQLFTDIPASAKSIPGSVTPNISADIQQKVDWSDLAAAYALQRRMKEDKANDWARAAAINNARMAQANASINQEHYLPGTGQTGSGMGAQYQGTAGGGAPTVMWAPRNLQGPQLGTWASQQQNRAVKENREMPMIMQAHTGDPFSPGETQGGSMAPVSSRGLYGPGLTSAMGGANPAVLGKMWSGGGGGGRTTQGSAVNPFPTQSLRERTSPEPQYQYDYFGGR